MCIKNYITVLNAIIGILTESVQVNKQVYDGDSLCLRHCKCVSVLKTIKVASPRS